MDFKNSGQGADPQLILNVSETLRDSAACGLLAVNPERCVISISPEAERLLQIRAAQILNRPAGTLPDPLPDLIEEAVLKDGKVVSGQMAVPRQGDSSHRIAVQAFTISSGKDALPGVILVVKDSEATCRLEQHMRRLDRLASIGTLSASMAHEVKNALVPVKTFVEVLQRENPQAELAGLAQSELLRVEALVSQMLRFAGPGKPTFAPIRVHRVLDQTSFLIRHHLEGKQIQFKRDYRATNDVVMADAYQLEQAFLNVLLNAIEAMNSGGCLTVETALDNPANPREGSPVFRVEIKDTGIGIEPENMKRLFETFFTTKSSGTGLGLAITRRIVQEHTGEIMVDSHPHQGTTVTLLFPSQFEPQSQDQRGSTARKKD